MPFSNAAFWRSIWPTHLAEAEANSDEARALRPLHRGSCVYRIAFGPRAGQNVLTLQSALPREASGKQKLCANLQGFSLHAAVRDGLSTTGWSEKDPGAIVSLHYPPGACE
jgi:hypothetical protein